MITSAQIIAKSQTEVATKLNTLLQYVPSGATDFTFEVTPFGANQFLIVVTWNQSGGIRTFSNTTYAGFKVAITKLQGKTKAAKLGLLATIKILYNELFAYVPKLGLKTTMGKVLVKTAISPKNGLFAKMRAKQIPTRIYPRLGQIILMTRKLVLKNPVIPTKLGMKAGFGQISKNGLPIMPW